MSERFAGASVAALMWAAGAFGAELLVEAEGFAEKGGWVVDQQFVDLMGSPYLLAHGMGRPVAHASTQVSFPAAGTYRVWVRTKDWVPGHAPGRFALAVGGAELSIEFGDTGVVGWTWQDGGTIDIAGGSVLLELRDLTGFEGRCDAIYFTTDLGFTPPSDLAALTAWRRALLGLSAVPPVAGSYDLVVAGGGIAGCCAAIAAARCGLSVALVHDRPFLGGNASQEVRVHTEGVVAPWIGDEVDTPHYPNGSAEAAQADAARHAVVEAEPRISLFLKWRAFAVRTEGSRIVALDARHTETGEERRFLAPLFVDSTGDGWLGYWAGAECRMGRESSAEFGESLAPETADGTTMGSSLLWNSYDTGSPVAFPEVSWAMDVAKTYSATAGEWFWEYGIDPALNTIRDAEEIRDHLFRAIYGSFWNAKQNPANANLDLKWVAYVAGKRESRRIVGDYILTQSDVVNHPDFPDAVAYESRAIDIHYPDTSQGVDFISKAQFTSVSTYGIPFRCLYSKDIGNLMMAGRCFSCSHVGLGSPRVMNTCGQMGVAVGCAAYLCKTYDTTPRGVYQNYIAELKDLVAHGDRVRVVCVVDNLDPGATVVGSWTSSTFDSGYYGSNYIHDGNADKGTKSVSFAPELPEAGTYTVYLRWTSSTNRATNVPVDILHSGGLATVQVNQREFGGQWCELGAYEFAAGAGGSVTIRTDGTDGYVIADAAMWGLPRAAIPTISPAGGSYSVEVEATLTCATPGAEIRFTLAGTRPSAASPLYTGPVRLTESCKLRAVALKAGMTESLVASASFVIEREVPGSRRGCGGVPEAAGFGAGLVAAGAVLVAALCARRASAATREE